MKQQLEQKEQNSSSVEQEEQQSNNVEQRTKANQLTKWINLSKKQRKDPKKTTRNEQNVLKHVFYNKMMPLAY
jgi:hypothetical protein